MKKTWEVAASLLLAGALATPAAAQTAQGPGDVRAELRELAARPRDADQDRAEVRRFLGNDRVRSVAAGMGIDVDALQGRVATLGSSDVADLADRVRQANETPLAGGDTFVITSTTVIIVLLIIILIIVA